MVLLVVVGCTLFLAVGYFTYRKFGYDTLDVCTCLGRYMLGELTGWKGLKNEVPGNALTAGK